MTTHLRMTQLTQSAAHCISKSNTPYFTRIQGSVLFFTTIFSFCFLGGCSYLPIPSQQQAVSSELPKELTTLAGNRTVNPRLLWQTKLAPGSNSRIEIHPKVLGDDIIVSGLDSVSSFNKKTGKLNWKETLGQSITGGVNVDTDTVFVGTEDGSAVALESKTGKTRWVTLLKQPIVAVSTSKENKVVFRTLNGKIHVLSTKDGELLWQKTQRTPNLSLQGASTPLLAGPLVITGFDNGVVTAYQLDTGKENWSVKLGLESGLTELSKLIDIDAEMKTVGTALFAVSYQGSIAGIDMRTGKTGWRRKLSSFTGIDANENELFVSDNQGYVWKLDPLTGKPAWKNDDLLQRSPTAPTLLGKAQIVVADGEGYLHWYNTKTGKIVGRIRADTAGYVVAPIVQDNTVYALGKSGLLSAYSSH